jgi:hypothetical protein
MWYGDTKKFVWYRIVIQIVLVQLLFWFVLGLVIGVLDLVLNISPSVRVCNSARA